MSKVKSVASKVELELLREEHIPAILAIEKVVNTAPWSEKSFRNELGHPHGIFLVATMAGEVAGYGGVWLVIDEAHVTTVAVAERFQGQGIGGLLMRELLTRAKSAGMVCSTLEVRASNRAAICLYEKLGYAATARRKGYYPENKEDAVVMWLYNLQDWEPAL